MVWCAIWIVRILDYALLLCVKPQLFIFNADYRMLEDVDRSIDNHSRDPLRRSGVNKVVNNVRELFMLLNNFKIM